MSLHRCRNSVKKVCDWKKKTFDIDSSESEYTSVRNGDVTFIKEQNTPTRIYSEEDGSGESDDCKTQCMCLKLVMFLFILQSEILSHSTSYVRNSDIKNINIT